MSVAGAAILESLAAWNAMSADDRDLNAACLALGAEQHFRSERDYPHLYEAWLELSLDASPLPIPYLPRGEA